MNARILKNILFLAIALAAVSLLWRNTADKDASDARENSAQPVHTVTVLSESFQPTETFSGFVRGIRQADISPQVSGSVMSLLKEPGERVQAGETLAILDGNASLAADQSASLSLEAARRSLRATQNYYRQKVKEAEASLKKTKESRDRGDATSKDVAMAKEALDSARRLRDAEIARAQTATAAAEGGKTVTEAATRDSIVSAPFSGTVIARNVSVGTLVTPGTVIYSIASQESLEIEVSVPIRIATTIAPNTSVSITDQETNRVVTGSVFSVAPAVRQTTGETPVRVRLDKTEEKAPFLLGQYVTVEFPAGPQKTSLLIPESSMLHLYDDTFVFTVENGIAHKRSVVVGQSFEGRREILSGLHPGEQLVIDGMNNLRDNMNIYTYATE